jgi:hypothetical protein
MIRFAPLLRCLEIEHKKFPIGKIFTLRSEMKNEMKTKVFILVLLCSLAGAQSTNSTPPPVVPPLVKFSGKAVDEQGKPASGIVGLTFAIYNAQQDGSPLWMETQNVTPDVKGNYSVELGSTQTDGLPLELFSSGEARWVGVRVNVGEEQPRVLLLSVPYALKAADAQTLGGLPPSAFALAGSASASAPQSTVSTSTLGKIAASSVSANTPSPSTVAGSGTEGNIPIWASGTSLGNSAFFQTGAGTSAKVGLGTKTPGAPLDVHGVINSSAGFDLAGERFAFGSAGNQNAFLGFAGNATTTGVGNFASGVGALSSSTTGRNNTASGATALGSNTTGSQNTASGAAALEENTTGTFNTASGYGALTLNSTGNNNTASGYNSGLTEDLSQVTGSGNTFLGASAQMFTGSLSNATAIGANTQVSASNATAIGANAQALASNATAIGANAVAAQSNTLVLGSISGVNGATASTYVGIGTMAPQAALDVQNSNGNGINGEGAIGVQGFGTGGGGNYGVYGVSYGQSGIENTADTGVWGDTNATNGIAVLGTAQDAIAGSFVNYNSDSNPALIAVNEYGSSNSVYSLIASSGSGDGCLIATNGNLYCSGSKSAVVPVDSGARKVALYAVEAPENWFEDFGSGQLSHGSARIDLEPTFTQTVNTDLDYHVFLTPNGDCKGLYLSQKSPTSFEVHELGGGTSSVAFDYRIVAKRKNYENVRLADLTDQYKKLEKLLARMMQRRPAATPAASNSAAASGRKPGNR